MVPDHPLGPKGRILMTYEGLRIGLHRLVWSLDGRELPRGQFLIQLCETRGCVSPKHHALANTPAPPRERAPRDRSNGRPPMWVLQKRRMFCPQGHPYSPENTYRYPTKAGGERRKCKTCTIARRRGEDPAEADVVGV